MKIFVFLVAIASILEKNGTFQNPISPTAVSVYQEQCAVSYGKSFLTFLKYVKIFDYIHSKYDPAKINQVAFIATECYKMTADIPELNTFNVILESMDIQEEMQRIIKQVQNLHPRSIYERVIPQFIRMADKFLSQAAHLRNPIPNLTTQTAKWKATIRKFSLMPLSSAVISCLQMIKLVEMNATIYAVYLQAVRAVPDDIHEDILLNLGKQVNLDLQLNRKEPLLQSILQNIADMKIIHPDDSMVVEEVENFKNSLLTPPTSVEQINPPPPAVASAESTAVAPVEQKFYSVDSSKTYLMFNRYLPVIKIMEKKLDNFNSVAKTADECYKITKNMPEMITLNMILLSMESELEVRSLVDQNPHTISLPNLYNNATPKLIQIMDRFLLAAMIVQRTEIHIESWANGWKNHLKELLIQPLSEEGKSCLRIIKLIETNPALYHSYFEALQVVPGDIIEEIVITLSHMANTLPTLTNRENLLPSRLKSIETHEPSYPDPVLLEEEIAYFESQLKNPNAPPPAPPSPPPEPEPAPAPAPVVAPAGTVDDGVLPRFLMRELFDIDKNR